MVVRHGGTLCLGQRMDAMICRTRARAEAEDRIGTEFEFTVSRISAPDYQPPIFRDPVALELHRRLAAKLRDKGFCVTDARPGKACDAAFCVQFPKFNVFVMIASERPDYSILTWCSRRMWTHVSPQEVANGWTRTCDTIETALKEDPSVLSMQRIRGGAAKPRAGDKS